MGAHDLPSSNTLHAPHHLVGKQPSPGPGRQPSELTQPWPSEPWAQIKERWREALAAQALGAASDFVSREAWQPLSWEGTGTEVPPCPGCRGDDRSSAAPNAARPASGPEPRPEDGRLRRGQWGARGHLPPCWGCGTRPTPRAQPAHGGAVALPRPLGTERPRHCPSRPASPCSRAHGASRAGLWRGVHTA